MTDKVIQYFISCVCDIVKYTDNRNATLCALSSNHKSNAMALISGKSLARGSQSSSDAGTLGGARGLSSPRRDNRGTMALTMPVMPASHAPAQTASPEPTPHEKPTPTGGGAAGQGRASLDAPPSLPQSASSADAATPASDPARTSLSPARSRPQVPSPSPARAASAPCTPTGQPQAPRMRKVFKKEALARPASEGLPALELDLNDPASIPYHVATMNLDPQEAANLAARRRARNKAADVGVPLLLTLHREGTESPRRRSPQLTPVISRRAVLPPTPKSAPPRLTPSAARKVSSQSQRVTFTIPEER